MVISGVLVTTEFYGVTDDVRGHDLSGNLLWEAQNMWGNVVLAGRGLVYVGGWPDGNNLVAFRPSDGTIAWQGAPNAQTLALSQDGADLYVLFQGVLRSQPNNRPVPHPERERLPSPNRDRR